VAVAGSLRLLAAPLLLGGLSTLFVTLPAAYVLQAAMPSGINGLVVGHAFGLDQRLLATTIVWPTAANASAHAAPKTAIRWRSRCRDNAIQGSEPVASEIAVTKPGLYRRASDIDQHAFAPAIRRL